MQKLSENPGDTEYGGENDTYEEEDLMFGNELLFDHAHTNALNSIRRVPVYGVRKLRDSFTISTDLIHSTLAYAAMAYNYNCLNKVVDQIEVLHSELSNQKIDDDRTNEERA
jgi:hypothetical protein